MIDVQQAVTEAIKYLQSLPVSRPGPPQNVALEEVELTDDERHWLITLSYRDRVRGASSILGPPKYKIFKVNTANGRVQSMKIRELK